MVIWVKVECLIGELQQELKTLLFLRDYAKECVVFEILADTYS